MTIKTIKTIGIICSVVIILDHIIQRISSLSFIENISFDFLQNIMFDIVTTLGFIGFYYAIQSFLDHFKQIKTRPFFYSLIGLQIIIIILKICVYYFPINLLTTSLNILHAGLPILFLIVGIKVLSIGLKSRMIKKLKIFIISMFVTYGVVLVLNEIMLTQLSKTLTPYESIMDYMNIPLSLFIIPYVFGLLFFTNLKETDI